MVVELLQTQSLLMKMLMIDCGTSIYSVGAHDRTAAFDRIGEATKKCDQK
jgi:hypothetical protein